MYLIFGDKPVESNYTPAKTWKEVMKEAPKGFYKHNALHNLPVSGNTGFNIQSSEWATYADYKGNNVIIGGIVTLSAITVGHSPCDDVLRMLGEVGLEPLKSSTLTYAPLECVVERGHPWFECLTPQQYPFDEVKVVVEGYIYLNLWGISRRTLVCQHVAEYLKNAPSGMGLEMKEEEEEYEEDDFSYLYSDEEVTSVSQDKEEELPFFYDTEDGNSTATDTVTTTGFVAVDVLHVLPPVLNKTKLYPTNVKLPSFTVVWKHLPSFYDEEEGEWKTGSMYEPECFYILSHKCGLMSRTDMLLLATTNLIKQGIPNDLNPSRIAEWVFWFHNHARFEEELPY